MMKEIRIEDISCLDNLSAKFLWHICLSEKTTTEDLVDFSGAHKDTISRKMSELVRNNYATKNKEGRNVIYISNMEKLEINRVKADNEIDEQKTQKACPMNNNNFSSKPTSIREKNRKNIKRKRMMKNKS